MITLHTNKGDITIQLFNDKAPETVNNFIKYCKDGFYDNTIFHRVIDNFMIQGGGFLSGMEQKSTRAPIKNEADNKLNNERGTIAMARTSDPHSATAQFFINVNDNDFLNFKSADVQGYGYCVFGKVINGMDIIDTIKSVKTTVKGMHSDVPVDDIIIDKVTVTND